MIRDIFQQRVQKGLIGPGSENWGLPDEEEIISDYPLVRYFSAILFPEKKNAETESEDDDRIVQNETEEPDPIILGEEADSINTSEKEIPQKNDETESEGKVNQNHFNPTNIGLTFCVEVSTEKIEVQFSGGLYFMPKQPEIRIKITEAGYAAFMDEKLGFPFKDILSYENGYLSLTRDLKGDKGGKSKRSGEYVEFDNFKKSEDYKDSSAKYHIENFEKLINRAWKRESFHAIVNVEVADTDNPVKIQAQNLTHKEFVVGYNVKTYLVKGNKYVKIQLINLSKKQSSRRFTNKTPELNQRCLFQAEIKVKSVKILPFKSNQELNPFDNEAEELNFLYRDVKVFGIGHNCAVNWDKENDVLQTTFLPEYNVKDTINEFKEMDFDNANDFARLNQSLDIKNLSIFSDLTQGQVIAHLRQFVQLYGHWIERQKKLRMSLSDKEKEISKEIIHRLDDNLSRLKGNIECLLDEDVFRAFQLANTAMLIQIIISNDPDFAKVEKDVVDINASIDYNNLRYFQEYDYSKINITPKYRPFQLAFLLLSIRGIVDPQSKDRKEIVDLIWFPTGGGKTEAYLAVTAFTIIYRRLIKEEKQSKGVSVIMRYTLRLLTAQQFERSSKLIASLEFLRRNFKDELKTEPITIGLWVGNQLTPGKIEEAENAIEETNRECNKKVGNPESKNIFQISACPWCGTKLISNGDYGFEANKTSFKIRCLNRKCAFNLGIPVQVVDEMLYKTPPTLLFATVDKFAQIAWKEETHKFFNSLDDEKLPPDLIIQDELHLLSGPLGSIVGIFESVVEKLCTNEDLNLTPKIIASTATTRNTNHQVSELYGGRKVNIFPPSGLNYDDSFFAKESKQASRRKYMGFMPVGKTSIDTQLQIIAHLLVARIEGGEPIDDNYWTLVSYYNSLKDVGKIRNKVGDEIVNNTSTLQKRLLGKGNRFSYNHHFLEDRVEELTARVDSSKIKTILKQLECTFALVIRDQYENVNDVIDLVLATNMFSVGIDISRLNVMLINGMPKNIAEYIQASSRIGRKVEGLVVTFLDPNRARDKSYFEHFIPFHQAFYKNIEPLSVTPFTENTIDKMLTTIMIAYLRNKIPGLNKDNEAQYFQKENLDGLISFLDNRFGGNTSEFTFFEREMNRLADDWLAKIESGLKSYKELLKRPGESDDNDDDWIAMQSMREVDSDTFIQIRETFSPKRKEEIIA